MGATLLPINIYEFEPSGHVGMPADGRGGRLRDGANSTPQAKQVNILTVTAATATDYVFVFNGITYTWTEVTATSTTTVALNIANFMRQQPAIGGAVIITEAAAVITLTAIIPGTDGSFTLTEADAQMTTANSTAAASAGTVTFGRAVVSRGKPTTLGPQHRGDTREVFAQASTAHLVVQVDTWTMADPTAGDVFATIQIPGEKLISVSAIFNTNLGTTIDDLDTALAQQIADLGLNTHVAITNTATTIVCTAVFAGVEFEFVVGSSLAAAHTLVTNKGWVAGSLAFTSFLDAFRGMARRDSSIVPTAFGVDATAYQANDPISSYITGTYWVEATGVTLGDSVYVDLTVGATAGQFYNAAAASRIKVPLHLAKWIADAEATGRGETMASLELNLGL